MSTRTKSKAKPAHSKGHGKNTAEWQNDEGSSERQSRPQNRQHLSESVGDMSESVTEENSSAGR